MFESIMGCSGIDKIRCPKLLDISQALELHRINNLQTFFFQPHVAVNAVVNPLTGYVRHDQRTKPGTNNTSAGLFARERRPAGRTTPRILEGTRRLAVFGDTLGSCEHSNCVCVDGVLDKLLAMY